MAEQKSAGKAGAGKAKIHFDESLFPMPEGFTGVHDEPSVKAVALEAGERYGILVFELVGVPRNVVGELLNYFAEYAQMPVENVFVHTAHVLSTPHGWNPHDLKSEEDEKKKETFEAAIRAAGQAAIRKAADHLAPAMIGYGTAVCGLNASRNIMTCDGVWLGSNEAGVHDTSAPIIKITSLTGEAIAVLYCYNAQPSIMDGSSTKDGKKLISADLCGSTSAFIEQEYGENCVAIYFTGAGGDQAPIIRANQMVVGKNGRHWTREIGEAGFVLVSLFGEHLGQQVVQAADRITCVPLDQCALRIRTFTFPGQKIHKDLRTIKPCKEYTYEKDEDIAADVITLFINDCCIVGVRPEICAQTVIDVRSRAKNQKMFIATFCNAGPDRPACVDANGKQVKKAGKYMGTAEMYDQVTYQSMNSFFGKGAAEKLSQHIVEALDGNV